MRIVMSGEQLHHNTREVDLGFDETTSLKPVQCGCRLMSSWQSLRLHTIYACAVVLLV